MHHHLEVNLAPRRSKPPIVECHTKSIGLRLWHRLFGRQRVVILFPGDTIDEITITEQPQAQPQRQQTQAQPGSAAVS